MATALEQLGPMHFVDPTTYDVYNNEVVLHLMTQYNYYQALKFGG